MLPMLFNQDEQGVTPHLVKHEVDKGVEETVRIGYLVRADGTRSGLLLSQQR